MTLLEIALHASQVICIVYLVIKVLRQRVEIEVWKDKLIESEIHHLNMIVRWGSFSETVREELKKFASARLEEIEKQLK